MVWGSRTDKYAKEFQCVLCLYELVFHSALGLETLMQELAAEVGYQQ